MERRRLLATVIAVSVLAGCTSERPAEPPAPPLAENAEFTEDAVSMELESAARRTIEELKDLATRSGGVVGSMSRFGNVVWVPPGSDALADAIAEAGDGGVVILQSGLHSESGTVTVDRNVRILGENGAVLVVDTQPQLDIATPIDPALHVLGTNGVVIWGVTLRPLGPIGGTAILLEDSPRATLAYNTIEEHHFSVLAQQSDRMVMLGNEITCSDAWQDGTISESHGVIICNAERAVLADNAVAGGVFGYWICDQRGVLLANRATASVLGFIFCKVPEGLVMPDGDVVGAQFSATRWVAKFNRSADCLDANYIVIDGSNNNLLAFNQSSNPGTYDIDLVGDSYRFGFLTPTSYENTVIVGNSVYVVKDCGLDNRVIGGILVDNDADPCF